MNSSKFRISAFRRFPIWSVMFGLVLVLSSWNLPAAGKGDSVRIEAFLVQARRALAENRLTLPAGDNAVGYAQEILNLVPEYPPAVDILRQVVSRYEALGLSVVDRAEALRRAELEKARIYQERGGRVAQRYHLPATGLRRLQEQFSAGPGRMTVPSAAGAGLESSAREALVRVAARYVTLSEAALRDSRIAEAERYLGLARELVSSYALPDPGLQGLTTKLASVQGSRATGTENEKRQAKASLSASDRSAKIAIFMPPAL